MTTLIAFCITILFSAWVYTLKQEVDYLHRRILGRGQSPPDGKRAGAPEHDKDHAFDKAVKSSASGVPTWTIE